MADCIKSKKEAEQKKDKEYGRVIFEEWIECHDWMDDNEDKWERGKDGNFVLTVPESEVPPVVLKVWQRERERDEAVEKRKAIRRSMGLPEVRIDPSEITFTPIDK